jgi:peptidoglycan/xylan/chitin deacetylase (PgdA/CDA1 family)
MKGFDRVFGLRRALKGTAERLLVSSGLPFLARKRHTGRCLVLAFHNILAPGHRPSGDRSLHLPSDDFERFLNLLSATHDVVALDNLKSTPLGERPRAAITFDDAYAGAILYGLPALAARGLPATLFVAPGILGQSACWWDWLADPIEGLGEAVREHALTVLRGEDGPIRSWAKTLGRALAAPVEDWRFATEEEIALAASQPGVTLGAHTWSHPNLAELSPAELGPELVKPLTWLRERFRSARAWLAYPYGMTSPRVAEAAEQAGYTHAFRVSGGWVAAPAAITMDLPRWSVPAGLTERGFILHASGVIGD